MLVLLHLHLSIKNLLSLTVHGVHRLKGHYFGRLWVGSLQQLLQVLAVVVSKDEPLGSTVSYSLNHRGMVPGVRVDLAAWNRHRGNEIEREAFI